MAHKEILLYSIIFGFSAQEYIEALEENKNSDIHIRLNSAGGDVWKGWGMIAKTKEHTKGKTGIVDGNASSMASAIIPYLDNVKAYNVASIMLHKATNNDPNADEQHVKLLDTINQDLLKAYNKKIDAAKFELVTGTTLEKIFSADAPDQDVWLTAEEAHQVGLIDEVIDINDETAVAELKNSFAAIKKNILNLDPEKKPTGKNTPIKRKKMTVAEFKAENPEAYKEILNEGIAAERDRVGAYVGFIEVDPEAVTKAIKEGTAFNNTALATLTAKAIKSGAEAQAEEESNTDGDAGDEDKGDGKKAEGKDGKKAEGKDKGNAKAEGDEGKEETVKGLKEFTAEALESAGVTA